MIPVIRLASSLRFVLIPLVLVVAALVTPGAAHDEGGKTRIQHLDGSGRATFVEIEPSVPGAAAFIHTTPGPIPKRGQLILPPSATPGPPTPIYTPRRW